MGLYTDFSLDFNPNHNGDISQLTDEGCVRQSIRNCVLLNSFDIPFNNKSCDIKKYLFENNNKITESEIIKNITYNLKSDPRLKDPEISITYTSDGQFCNINVTVYVVSLNNKVTEIIKVEKVR